jgi:uncharacterized protein YjbI with pentapeptide repeats
MKSGQRWDLLVRGAASALSVALPSAAASRGSVVLLELKVADVSPTPDVAAAAASLSASGKTARAWLAGHLEGLGYAVVEGGRAESVLQSLGTSAGVCADADCAARLANALGARRAVIARLIKVSTIVWFLEGMIVDAGGKRILRREQLELKGDVAQLLPHATLSLARRLAAADPSPAEPGPAAPPHKQGFKPSRDHVLQLLHAATETAPADLSGLDLSGLDLEGVDFRRADLSRSRLVGTNLKGAQLFAVKLTDATATGAVLSGAVLDLAVLERADLSGADLHEASLYATILTRAVLVDANLTHARIISAMPGARLTRAKLAHANLGSDPGNQPMGLMRTDATGADLAGADLSGANLRKVNFTRADLSGADLTGADVAGADFTEAILRAIRGRSQLRGTQQAKNLERHTPEE